MAENDLKKAVAMVMDFPNAAWEWTFFIAISAVIGAAYLVAMPFILLRRAWRVVDLWARWGGDTQARARAEDYARWRGSYSPLPSLVMASA